MPIASLCIDAGCVLKGDGGRKWTTRSNIQVVFPDPEFAFPGEAGTKSFPLQRRVATLANYAWLATTSDLVSCARTRKGGVCSAPACFTMTRAI